MPLPCLPLLPSILLVLLSLLSCFCSPSSAQSLDYTQLSIVSITSSGSCQDVYPAAWNCTLPSTLSITLTTPPSSLPSALYFIIDGSDSETYTYALRAVNSTTYVGTVSIGGYALGLMGRPLAVSVFDYVTGNRSQAFVGLSFALRAPPVFASIGGCQGSGAVTTNCLPDAQNLTFTGSGLSIFSGLSSYLLQIGAASVAMGPSVILKSGLQVVNDSYAVLPLSLIYASILTPSQYGGAVYPISFNLQWRQLSKSATVNFLTNALSVSFAPLQHPQATFFSSNDCQVLSTSPPALTNCLPGFNAGVIALVGHYLISPTVTLSAPGLGTWPSGPITSSTASRLYFVLPVIPVDTTGQAWDVTVSTAAGSVTFPGLVTFSSAPFISAIANCRDAGIANVPNCAPGTTVSLTGDHFPVDPLMRVVVTSTSTMMAAVNVSCLQPTLVNANLITCVVPTLNSTLAQVFYGASTTLRVVFPSTGQTSNAYMSWLMAWPNSPLLTRVSGCEANNGSLALVRCRGGDVVTVQGSDISFYSATNTLPNTIIGLNAVPNSANRGVGTCTVLPGGNSTFAQCRLPYVDATDSLAQEGVVYDVQWYGSSAGYAGILFGNFFTVSFTFDPRASPTPEAASSSSNAMAIVVGVAVPVVVVVVGVVVWLAWRRRRCIKSSSPRSPATEEGARGAEWPSSSSSRWFSRSANPAAQYENGGVELE